MSLPGEPILDIPELTVEIAWSAFPNGNIYMQMRDELGVFYDDKQFTDLFSHTGQPAIAPWRLALITVMQFAENLTDRQAADAVRARIDWKYALSLEMQDTGFHYSVLSEFRGRLIAGGQAELLLQKMLDCFKEKKFLKQRGKQRTDSTYVLAAMRHLNQLELVHETLRCALNELAVQAPAWLKRQVNAEWFDHYSQRTSNYLLPKKEEERQAWAKRVGQDGIFLLEQIYWGVNHAELRELSAVEVLRQVWLQNFYQDDRQIRLRQQKDQPPSALRITSPYELEARCSSKRDITWTGYKVHLTETCGADSPNLIINVETRTSTEPDHAVTGIIHDHLARKEILPAEHYVDQGYMSVEHLVQADKDYGLNLMGAVPNDNSWQVRQQGYDSRHFTIDWDNECAVCPQNQTSCSWSLAKTRSQRPVVKIKFRCKDCNACPQVDLCTNNKEKRRTLTVLAPQAHFEAQQEARQRQQTMEFKKACQLRAGVEGTVSQVAYTLGARQSRYRGVAKTHLQNLATAAAGNLLRIIAWLNDVPRAATPKSRFALLAG
ncbi:MAG: IS1182 family transposase [Chloroflexi bacterium]|nr:IS1182 family transposase [Chloroflexota bacterium]